MRGALALLILVALSSGCVALGAERLEVRVTDEPGGPPIEGARVVARSGTFWFESRDEDVTDADGIARLAMPRGATVYAEQPGYVRESIWIPDTAASHVDLPLYRERVVVEIEATLVGADASTHGTPIERWDPHEVALGRNAEATAGYARRALTLDATLYWNNTLLAAGDLALALGKTDQRAEIWQDGSADQSGMGAHTESVSLGRNAFSSADWIGARQLFAGAAPGKAWASATGIAYRIVLDARFAEPFDSPNAIVGALAALAIAATILHRRGAHR